MTILQEQTSPSVSTLQQKELRRVATASFIGNFVEWFDYAAYGYLASIIAVVFFPQSDQSTGLLAAFMVFALSFLVRPLGGIFWGHIGDRCGRKRALSLSIIIMSCATFFIGLLPNYQSIGIFSPLLLLLARLVQGFSASGEYAGAATFLTEYAPKKQRGIYASIVPASTAAGLLFGAIFVSILYVSLDDQQMYEWGWRTPFLLAAPFGLIGCYIRNHLEDSPEYRSMAKKLSRKNPPSHTPIALLWYKYPTKVVIAFFITSLNAVAFYMLLSYMPTYLSINAGMDQVLSFSISAITLMVYIILVFIMGYVSDCQGRKRMLMLASISFILFSVPLFMLLHHGSFWIVLASQIAFCFMLAMNDGTLACYLTELFPVSVRYSGFAFSFNSANALFGGSVPLVATWLINISGNTFAPAYYLMGVAFLALLAIMFSGRSNV